jgi:hypothetical protein
MVKYDEAIATAGIYTPAFTAASMPGHNLLFLLTLATVILGGCLTALQGVH